MGLQAELGCPQCGAPVGLDEADHLVICPFCKVTSFLTAASYHFVLPAKGHGDELLFAPYLRFKGVVYCATDTEILHRIADVTSRGVSMPILPISLGVRPQAIRLRFAEPGMGSFLKNSATVQDAVSGVTKGLTLGAGTVRHLCMIGETISRIYLPIVVRRGHAYDAVTGDNLGRLPPDRDLFAPLRDPGFNWQPQALAAICPQCGWNLEGDSSSVVLICHQCDTAWQADREGYVRVDVSSLFPRVVSNGGRVIALPFWRIEVEAKKDGVQLRTQADFSRLVGHPLPRRPDAEGRAYAIWSPAFKVRPKLYLQAARQLTTLQTDHGGESTLPREIHPVTLPLGEAMEAIPLIMASTATRKREVLALLPDLAFNVTGTSLIFIPFAVTFHDLVQNELGVSLNRKALEFGRAL